jgi:signal transduction histidine kinase
MKRITVIALVMGLGLCLVGYAIAGSATKDECVAKTKEAAQLISEKGVDAAITEINNKSGKFVWKDTYVFLMDLQGTMLAHPMSPSLIGKNLLATPDKSGKMLFVEFVDVAKKDGSGWVDYMWPKPGEETPSKKISYIYRVPGQDYLLGAGIYE